MSEKRIFLDYLLDMREALSDIHDFTLGISFEAFRSGKKTLNAVLCSLEVLGWLPARFRQRFAALIPTFLGRTWLACATD